MSVRRLVVLFVVASLVAAGRINIIGGAESKTSVQYMASLHYTHGGSSVCSAVLVAPRHVVTASHCLKPDLRYVSIGGLSDDGADGERRKIVQQIGHPAYSNATHSFDVAIVKLNYRSNQPPVPIDWDNDSTLTESGKSAWIRGFGTTSYGSDEPLALYPLKEALVTIWSRYDCDKAYRGPINYRALLCVGNRHNSNHPCFGDSGGPLVVKQSDGLDYLVGICSATVKCGTMGIPSLYGRIHSARDFITPFLAPEVNENPPAEELRPSKAPPFEILAHRSPSKR